MNLEMGERQQEKLLEFQGKRYVAQAAGLVFRFLGVSVRWGLSLFNGRAAETKRFSLCEGGLSHPRLLRHFESLGIRIQTTSARRKGNGQYSAHGPTWFTISGCPWQPTWSGHSV